MAGFLGLALLPAAAVAVSPDVPSTMPMAIAHPVAVARTPPATPGVSPRVSEAGLLVLVGAGLLALGSVVRRTTSV